MSRHFPGKEAAPIFGWTECIPVDQKAVDQLHNVAKMPFIHHHVAVMQQSQNNLKK